MHARNSKPVRLCGWLAILVTTLGVAAAAFLSYTYFQDGDLLRGGIVAGLAAAGAGGGGLISYVFFYVARIVAEGGITSAEIDIIDEPGPAPLKKGKKSKAEIAVVSEPIEEVTASDSDDIDVALTAVGAPEHSDDALPVYEGPSGSNDSLADLLDPVVGSSDSASLLSADELPVPQLLSPDGDSRMDLPVRIDFAESLDETSSAEDEPARSKSPTSPVVSARQSTEEAEVVLESPSGEIDASEIRIFTETARPASSLPSAFPDIFKSAPPPAAKALPTSLPVAAQIPAPAPAAKVPAPAAPAPAPAPKPAAAVAKPAPKPAAPAAEMRPPAPRKPPEPEQMEELTSLDQLTEMTVALSPKMPTGAALPSEIPDFFLRMPTGRAMPGTFIQPPVAPLPPAVAKMPATPAPVHPPAAVRIVDSSTPQPADNDSLITLTSIPDDWPS